MRELKNLISERLKKYLQDNNIQQKELAKTMSKQLGYEISPTAINNWVNGNKEPRGDKKAFLFNLLNMTISDFETQFHEVELKKFPVLGRVACGEPIWAEEDKDCFVMAEATINADFVLFCKGDSMTPLVNNGDIVFVKKQDSVNNGEVAVVLIDNEATLKRVYQDNDKITLIAENRAFAPIVILASENKDIRICGKAVFFQRLID